MQTTLQALERVKAAKAVNDQKKQLDKLNGELHLISSNLRDLAKRRAELEDLQVTLPTRLKINKKYSQHLKQEALKLAQQIAANPQAAKKPILGFDENGTVQVVLSKLADAQPLGLSTSWVHQVLNHKATTQIYAGLFWTKNPNTPQSVIEAHFNRYRALNGKKTEKNCLVNPYRMKKDNDIFNDC